MLTFFSIPKPFIGHTGIIQENALRSWGCLGGCEVILFGDEEGVAGVADRLGVCHVPEIRRNAYGTPLVNDAFEQAKKLATNPILVYVNADIMFDGSILEAARAMLDSGLGDWLLVGRRHDLDIVSPLDFGQDWQRQLKDEVAARGVLHGKAGIDYFMFKKNLPVALPEFAVGRPGWDSWLIYQSRMQGLPLIDATKTVMVIHQNHPPAYRPYGAEALDNTKTAGGYYRMGTLRDANWELRSDKNDGLSVSRNLPGIIFFSPPLRALFAIKRRFTAWLAGIK